MRCVVCLATILFISLPVPSQTQPTAQQQPQPTTVTHAAYPHSVTNALAAQIATLLADPSVSRAHWGIAVTTVDGTPIFGFDEDKFFRPASNAKLYTTAAAMALLGPDTRVTTVVSSDGPPDANGIVHGDIVLHGVGDANLSGRRIPYENPAAYKARISEEKAAEEATEKATADAAGATERERQRKAGTFTGSFDERLINEAETEALIKLHAQQIPNELAGMEDLASQIGSKGVKGLTGALRGDADLWRSPTYADTWDEGDAVWGYGTRVSALEFNDGQLQLTVTPGPEAGQPASVQLVPDVAFGMLTNQVTTVGSTQDANLDIVARPFPNNNIAVGSVAVGHPDTEEVAVQSPALFAVSALETRLFAHGIKGGTGAQVHDPPQASAVSTHRQVYEPVDLTFKPESLTSPICGRDFPCGFVLAKHVSPTLAEDVTVTLKVSQNLHAEMLLRRLGRAYGTEGSFAQGSRVLRQWLLNAGLDGDDFVFYDGSGLSSHDLVTPRTTAQLLAYASKQPWFPQWKAALPVGGEDGSLTTRFPDQPLKDHVFAKTGTLGESRALSGYLDCASGREVIFSIYVDDHGPGSPADRVTMDKIVAAIAAGE